MSTVIIGSGKTLAFGIPMIHTILEWKNGSEKPADGTEPTVKVESLYLPAEDKPTMSVETATEDDQEDNMEAEEEEDEGRDQDHCDSDESASQGDECDAEEINKGDGLGCVQVIENAEFDFDPAAEAEEKHIGGQRQPLLGLVLTPTRELAVQVKHHIDAVAKFTGKSLLVI